MSLLDTKVIDKRKVDKELSIKISKNDASERIFVEFSSKDGKLVLQRSFQDTHYGRIDAAKFENHFKTIEEFKAHFKIK
jgi:hypothetical protein